MKALAIALCALMTIPIQAYALDYQLELTFVEKVEHLRQESLTPDIIEKKVIEYTTRYYQTPSENRPDKMLYALDELYHERLNEIINLYIDTIPDVNLQNPIEKDIPRIARFLIGAAQLPQATERVQP